MVFEHVTIENIPDVAGEIIRSMQTASVFCFYGELGTGKTTLIQDICKKLQVQDAVASPTYPIINEYKYPGGILYHIDLYRLKSIDEAVHIGLEEYLYSGNLCFIEWPDHFESLLPETHIKIFIRKLEEDSRTIEIVSIKK